MSNTMRQSGVKLTPNLDQQSTNLLNLTVLQRFDPSIQDIILTASHVALYEFNVSENQWSRKDVQGSLFVVKRNKEPLYQFIVMNQRSTENLVENLSGNFDFDLQVPYLLYRNNSQEVNGIWFYNPPECKLVADLFNKIIASYPRSISEPLESNQSEYKELEPAQSVAVMERHLEPIPPSSSTSVNPTGGSEMGSLSDFFNVINISNVEKPTQTYHPSSENLSSLGSSNLIPTPSGLLQTPSSTTPSPIFNLINNQHDISDSNHRSNQIANLVTPAIFHTPHSSTVISLPPLSSSTLPTTLHPSLNVQRPYGAPFLQPYPPPSPSPFLTPHNAVTPTNGPVIDRGKVREALLELVQDDQFIDMFYKALQRSHQG